VPRDPPAQGNQRKRTAASGSQRPSTAPRPARATRSPVPTCQEEPALTGPSAHKQAQLGNQSYKKKTLNKKKKE